MDVLVLGSALVDLTIKTTSDFKLIDKDLKKYISIPFGSKVEVDELEIHVGGSGHNVAVDLAKFDNSVGLIGKVGDDHFGDQIIENLKQEGVNIKNLKAVKNGKTGFSIIFLVPSKDKSILVHEGYNLDLKPIDIPKKELKESKFFLFTSLTSKSSVRFLEKAIDFAQRNGVKVLANPSIRMIRSMKKELLHFIENSDIIIMNREEVEGLTGIKNMNLAMKRLNKLNAETVVVTLGSKGAVAFDGKKFYKDRGFNPRVVDPTGCGDSFTSGFLHCILKGKDIPRALNFANANAALEILDIGQHGLSESSVLKFISKH